MSRIGVSRGWVAGATIVLLLTVPVRAGMTVVPSAEVSEGIVVTAVQMGHAGARAGLRPGDVIISWSHLPGAPGILREGTLPSPFDLWAVEAEESPRGRVRLVIVRHGEQTLIDLGTETWGISARPVLPDGGCAYDETASDRSSSGTDSCIAEWGELAERRDVAAVTRAWLQVQIGLHADAAQAFEEADKAFDQAIGALAQARDRALALLQRGRALRQRGLDRRARDVLKEALRESGGSSDSLIVAVIRQELAEVGMHGGGASLMDEHLPVAFEMTSRLAPESLVHADALSGQCRVFFGKGDFVNGETACHAALNIRQTLYPESLEVAESLRWLGMTARMRGRLDDAEVLFDKSLELAGRVEPDGADFARSLGQVGLVAAERGDLKKAIQARLRAVSVLERVGPRDWFLAVQYQGLGGIAFRRGDLGAAEDWLLKARTLLEATAPGYMGVASIDVALGTLSLQRGDLVKADQHLERALPLFDPASRYAAWVLTLRGQVAERRGDLVAAEALERRALVIEEKDAPGGLDHSECLQALGRIAEARDDLASAQSLYLGALHIRRHLAAGSQYEAESVHALGVVARKRGRLDEAEDLLRRAADVLDVQKGRLGGAEDVQSGFAASYSGFYQDLLEILVGRKNAAGALSILERSRARRLLALMSERDLMIEDEIPPELARERRRVDAEYERTRDELRQLKDAGEASGPVARLRELRDRQAALADRVRDASPRLAEFTDATPLDAEGVGAALEPGTVLLEYAVGTEQTVLLAIAASTKATPEVEALTIPIGSARLAERIERLRQLAEETAPSDQFFSEARALYDLLLLPAERHVRDARHLLISPDGPLHHLPFAALRHRGGYIAEWKPVSVVPSGTIYAQLVGSRRSAAHAVDLVAFGNPRSGGGVLPASRGEVQGLAKLFGRSQVLLEEDASELRAKSSMKGARYVHFACHGLIDDRFPLDSALALSGSAGGTGSENGMLHAWEVFESVRLDAELVTLSACHSASGAVFAGEGLLGLTRAFQYAGARSVLASLWTTGDKSTSELMTRFYTLLKAGVSKDEALRQSQVESIRRGRHPVRWANFQLYGDWR